MKHFAFIASFVLVLSFSCLAVADGPGTPGYVEANPSEREGVSEEIPSVQSAYTQSSWEEDLNSMIDQINAMSPEMQDLLENQDRLVARPDGQPLRDLGEAFNQLSDMVSEAVGNASHNPDIMDELKALQERVDERVERLDNYHFGPSISTNLVRLTGEGSGVFQVELNNGEQVNACYVVGSNLRVNPDVENYAVVAMFPLPSAAGDGKRWAYGYGSMVRGESTAIISWMDHAVDESGARWTSQRVHNISPSDWRWMKNCEVDED